MRRRRAGGGGSLSDDILQNARWSAAAARGRKVRAVAISDRSQYLLRLLSPAAIAANLRPLAKRGRSGFERGRARGKFYRPLCRGIANGGLDTKDAADTSATRSRPGRIRESLIAGDKRGEI